MRLIKWIEGRRRLDWWLSALVLLLAAGDAWASRHQIGPDGISYLDVATVVFAHGIRAGASVAWSPAYTWLVGAALELVHPSRPHELIVVMAVNVLIVMVVLVAFAWWLRELLALFRHRQVQLVISEPILRVLAYSVLAWAVLSRVTSSVVEPDMLLGAVGFAATALLMRIGRLGGSAPAWLGLGVLLGIGYLVKSGFAAGARRMRRLRGPHDGRRGAAAGGARAHTRRVRMRGRAVRRCAFEQGRAARARRLRHAELRLGRRRGAKVPQLDGRERSLRPTRASDADRAGAADVRVSVAGRGQHSGLVRPAVLVPGCPAAARARRPDPGARRGDQGHSAHGRGLDLLILLLVPLAMLWRGRRRDRFAGSRETRAGPWWRRALHALADNAYLALAVAGIITNLPLLVADRYIAVYVAIIVITAFLFACSGLARPDLPGTLVDRVVLATALVALVTFVFAARHPVEHVADQLTGSDAPGTGEERIARALSFAGIGAGDGVAFNPRYPRGAEGLLGAPGPRPRCRQHRRSEGRVLATVARRPGRPARARAGALGCALRGQR